MVLVDFRLCWEEKQARFLMNKRVSTHISFCSCLVRNMENCELEFDVVQADMVSGSQGELSRRFVNRKPRIQRERSVRETKLSITGKHVGFEDLPWVRRSPKEKREEKDTGTEASAWKRTREEDMLQKPWNRSSRSSSKDGKWGLAVSEN